MAPPYRTSPSSTAAPSPRDRGIVGDIIEQFADPYAFLRELVQNAIDADTPVVEIDLSLAEPDAVRVAVRDRGCGMSRDIIENRLLVLFRSTKEGDSTKIGKFGVGFASVLAMQPRVIRVDSVRDDRRHVLHLYPDLSYELFDAGRAQQAGTVVELEIELTQHERAVFAAACRASLERWCRHATVPISFTAAGADAQPPPPERIDRPLGLDDALAEVHATSPDGHTRAVVGLAPGAQPYLGLFNHGLTLYETREPLLGRLAVKLQDARLGHTLSRDNVRRDAAFDGAIAFARRVAERELPAAVARALRDAAGETDRSRYMRIADAATDARETLPSVAWTFPLTDEVAGARAIDSHTLGVRGAWVAGAPSATTRALASLGVPVVDLGPATDHLRWFVDVLHRVTARRPRDVHADLVLVAALDPTDSDLVLLDRLEGLLTAAIRRPAGVALAEIEGPIDGAVALAVPAREPLFGRAGQLDGRTVRFYGRGDIQRDPFRRLARAALVLNANSPHVRLARARAQTEPAAAADLLARAILLARDKLTPSRSERLLELTLDDLVGADP